MPRSEGGSAGGHNGGGGGGVSELHSSERLVMMQLVTFEDAVKELWCGVAICCITTAFLLWYSTHSKSMLAGGCSGSLAALHTYLQLLIQCININCTSHVNTPTTTL